MMRSRALRRLAAVSAAIGIALQGLWPLVAQAGNANAIAVQICSAGGSHRTIDQPVDGERSKQCAEHCRLFVTGGGKPVIAGKQCGFALLQDGDTEAFFRKDKCSAKPAFAVSFRPRAPPVSL